MKIKIWGTRGSIPVPGVETIKYGGNTLSVELRYGKNNQLIIIDGGTGIRLLGQSLLKELLPYGPIKAKLFFSHTHWDHIMGFPFFVPIFIPGTELTIYGPVTYEGDRLDKTIGDQLQYRYFPVKYSELSAKIDYITLKECKLDLGDGMLITTKYLNHPVSCLGYRFEYGGKIFCTIFDHEPFRNLFPTDPAHPDYDEIVAEEGELVAQEENQKIFQLYQGAHLLIHDCQYTKEEYLSSKKGWGHSYFDDVLDKVKGGNVQHLLLIHHDPLRSDKELDELQKYCQSLVNTKMRVTLAREGQEIHL